MEEPFSSYPSIASTSPPQESITLFQGFRAQHPRKQSLRNTSHTKQSIGIPAPQISVSPSISCRSRSSRLPEKARHPAMAINNIASIFNQLLNERERLLEKSDFLELERVLEWY